MHTDEASPQHLDPELAARLDRLAQRRTHAPTPAPAASAASAAASPAIDEQLADRLARLQTRRLPAGSAPASVAPAAGTPATKPAKRRRRHPAKKARIAALALSVATTGGLAGGFAALDGPGTSAITAAGGIVQTSSASIGGAATSGSAVAGSSGTEVAVVNGDVYTNKWGPVQVEATFGADGNLVSVDAVQTPYVDSKSVRINDQAVPRLNSEALAAQSANVDTVTGATYTSIDYERSLQSAIDAARDAGITQIA